LIGVAVTTGAVYPPSPSVLRARFPELLGSEPHLVPSAYALDSVLLEITFVCAPLLVVLAVAALGPGAALVLSAATVLAGVAVFVWLLPEEARLDASAHDVGLLGALHAPGIRILVMTMVPIGFAIGALEVAVPAFSASESSAKLAGVLLATWSLGSAAGGLVYGARTRQAPLPILHMRLTLAFPLSLVPLLFAPSMALMAMLLIPAGALIAPIIASRNELASEAAPPGTKTEALTWPLTALVGGIALGAAGAGALIDESGWRAAVAAAVLAAAAGGAIAASRRTTLQAAIAPARSV